MRHEQILQFFSVFVQFEKFSVYFQLLRQDLQSRKNRNVILSTMLKSKRKKKMTAHLFFKLYRLPIVTFIFCVGISMIYFFFIHLFIRKNIETTITVISLIFTLGAIVFSGITSIRSEKNQNVIKEATRTQINDLSIITERVKIIQEGLLFSSVAPFPNNIKDINKLITKYGKEESSGHKYLLDIYTDVPGYSIFTNHTLWNQYFQTIENTKMPIHWYFYGEDHLKRQRDRQFSSWENYSVEKFKDELRVRKERIKMACEKCTFDIKCKSENQAESECCIFNQLKYIEFKEKTAKENVFENVKNVKECVKNLNNIAFTRIKTLTTKSLKKYFRLDTDLPFFAWIILEEKIVINNETGNEEKKGVPIAGIISYNVYDDKKDLVERGFKTIDTDLIQVLYDIVHSDAINQFEYQEKNRAKIFAKNTENVEKGTIYEDLVHNSA
jgi:hypothetical protein